MSFQPLQILSKESWMEYIYKARVLYRSVSIPPTTYIFKVGGSLPRRWWQLHDPPPQSRRRSHARPSFYLIFFFYLSLVFRFDSLFFFIRSSTLGDFRCCLFFLLFYIFLPWFICLDISVPIDPASFRVLLYILIRFC
jgi:hypothetical protein